MLTMRGTLGFPYFFVGTFIEVAAVDSLPHEVADFPTFS